MQYKLSCSRTISWLPAPESYRCDPTTNNSPSASATTRRWKDSPRLRPKHDRLLGSESCGTLAACFQKTICTSLRASISVWRDDEDRISRASDATTHALKIRPVWLQRILSGTDRMQRHSSSHDHTIDCRCESEELPSTPCPRHLHRAGSF